MTVPGAPPPGWWMASDGNWYPPQQAPGGPPARKSNTTMIVVGVVVGLAVIAVLALIGSAAVDGVEDNSNRTACKIEERTFATAIEAYRADNRALPASEADLVGDFLESDMPNMEYELVSDGQAYEYVVTPVGTCADVIPARTRTGP